MVLAIIAEWVVRAVDICMLWRTKVDLLFLGYLGYAFRSYWVERRLNTRDWNYELGCPMHSKDIRLLESLEEERRFGRNLNWWEARQVSLLNLGALPPEDLWLIFKTRKFMPRSPDIRRRNEPPQASPRSIALFCGLYVAALQVVFLCGAIFAAPQGALFVVSAIGRILISVCILLFSAYITDLLVTRPGILIWQVGLREYTAEEWMEQATLAKRVLDDRYPDQYEMLELLRCLARGFPMSAAVVRNPAP